jgi:protease-4
MTMEDYGNAGRNVSATSLPTAGAAAPGAWERGVIEKLVSGLVEEKRRARRWAIFFRLVGLAVIGVFLLLLAARFIPDMGDKAAARHTAVIDVKGVIDVNGEASAENVITSLRAAFKSDHTAGVVVRINSPGGSPVQAGMIHDEMRRLRARHATIPLYAVVEEVCASGGYYIAAAADQVFVDKASLVGSIGVLMDGFGFVGTMEKLGVERRLLTAGRNKGFLDSFSPMSDEQKAFAQQMLGDIHRQFIDVVRKGRGERLKEAPELFSGLVWTGEKSIELGLADGLGTVDSVARDVVKAEELMDYSSKENLAERLARKIGASMADSLVRSLRTGLEVPGLR